MRILHTADWHLNERLGRVDLTPDLRRAVEWVADVCEQRRVDVLLVAGDLFSELSRSDERRDSVKHLAETFRGFLTSGGTILAVTGNHDDETFCQTLRAAGQFVAPVVPKGGGEWRTGQFHLVTGPAHLKLTDRDGVAVQFLLMPYPTAARYLQGERLRYGSIEEKRRRLSEAFQEQLARGRAALANELPTVLAAHLAVDEASIRNGLYRLTEREDILFPRSAVPTELAYVALGHVHQAQSLWGADHVRYSGSLERLDMGERDDAKGAVLVEIGPGGREGPVETIAREATPMYDVVVTEPQEQLDRLTKVYPEHARALVRCRVHYRPGEDSRPSIEAVLRGVFPRCYDLKITPHRADEGSRANWSQVERAAQFGPTVQNYLSTRLADDPDRDPLLRMAEELAMEDDQ